MTIEGINCYQLNGQGLLIKSNNITNLSTNNSFYGIDLSYAYGVKVQLNKIKTNSIEELSHYGIYIDEFSTKNIISENTINALSNIPMAGPYILASGLYVENSPSNTLTGNNIDKFPLSSFFNGNCDNTDLKCNFFSKYKNAVNLGNSETYVDLPTVIGIQKYKFNSFVDNLPLEFEIKAAPDAGINNRFIIHTNQGTYWPNPVTPEKIREYVPVSIVENPCHFEVSVDVKLTDAMNGIIQGDTIPGLGGPMTPSVKWNYEWTTFDVLHHNPQILQENSDAAYYYSQTTLEPLGQLYLVNNFIYDLLPNISEGRSIAIQNIINNLNSIICTQVYEQNMKSVLRIMLENLLIESSYLSENQVTILLSIADQCSIEGGRGVNIARVMLGTPEQYREYDHNMCEIMPRESSDKNDQFKVSPNPGTGVFRLTVPSKFNFATVIVLDLNGKKAYSKSLNKDENNFEIDISHLETGIYFAEIYTNNNEIYRNKLVLVR